MFCKWPMGLFTRPHRIPPATASIHCLATHKHSPWPVPHSCVCLNVCVHVCGFQWRRVCVVVLQLQWMVFIIDTIVYCRLNLKTLHAVWRICTASPILLHRSLISMSGGTNTGELRKRFSVNQQIKSGRNASGTKHLVLIMGLLARFWPGSQMLNQPIMPLLQPPLYLSSWFVAYGYTSRNNCSSTSLKGGTSRSVQYQAHN